MSQTSPDLNLAARLLALEEKRRADLARLLHDSLCQDLGAAAFTADFLSRSLARMEIAPVEAAAELQKFADLLRKHLRNAHTLSRELYPAHLASLGLAHAVSEFALAISEQHRVTCQVANDGAFAMNNPADAIHVFRMIEEAVQRAVQHGKATHVEVHLTSSAGTNTVCILDHGGPGPWPTSEDFQALEHRAQLLGGALCITPHADRNGLQIEFSFPG